MGCKIFRPEEKLLGTFLKVFSVSLMEVKVQLIPFIKLIIVIKRAAR